MLTGGNAVDNKKKQKKKKHDIVSLYFVSLMKTFRFALVSYCSSSGTQEVMT